MRQASLRWAPPLYFLYYAAAATLIPFLAIYYQDLGLTGAQIGFLAGMPPLLSLVSAPIWGVVADVMKRRKPSLLIAIGGAALLALVLPAIKAFIWLIPAVMLFAFFYSPIMPLVDTTTISLLSSEKERYGQLRLWGAIGWGVAAPIVGWLIETDTATWSFWGYAGLMGLGFLIALGVPESARIETGPQSDTRVFFTSRRWLVFLTVAFCGGMALSMISNFLFLFLRGLGADEFSLGLMLTVATLSELPVLFFSSQLLRRWSAQRLISIALLLFAIRALAYSLIHVPWLALLIQLMHGPTFSLMWVAGVSYADKIAPPSREATAQGLFAGVMLGIGAAAGAFVGGLLYEYMSPLMMFRLAALGSLVSAGFILRLDRKDNEHSI